MDTVQPVQYPILTQKNVFPLKWRSALILNLAMTSKVTRHYNSRAEPRTTAKYTLFTDV